MKLLEGYKLEVYTCTSGFKTIGIGTNLERSGIEDTWKKLGLIEDLEAVLNGELISETTAKLLFNADWEWCIKKADERASKLGLSYKSMPEWHRFILADIVYNTGSINKWSKVLKNTTPKDVLIEARRTPHKLMDTRVCKIGYYYKLISSIEHARKIGLTYSKYLV